MQRIGVGGEPEPVEDQALHIDLGHAETGGELHECRELLDVRP